MSGFCSFLFTISSIYKLIYCRWWKIQWTVETTLVIIYWRDRENKADQGSSWHVVKGKTTEIHYWGKRNSGNAFSLLFRNWRQNGLRCTKKGLRCTKKVFGASARLIDILSTVCAYTILQSVLLWLDKRTKSKKQNNPKIVHNQIEFL